MVLSLEADATKWPDGEKQTDITASCDDQHTPRDISVNPVC